MSRGLGRLQRFIKDQIYRVEREYQAEADALDAAGSDDEPKSRFWLTWPEIRILIEDNPDFNLDLPYRISPSLERSAKRALHLLVKRGDIARWPTSDQRYLTRYLTKETDQEVRNTGKAIMEGFARMEAEGTSPERSD
jgi:hypothetical protein